MKKKQVQEIKNSKIDFDKIQNSKIFDIVLILLSIGLLLFIHHYALVEKTDNNYVYYINEEGLPHFFDMDSYYYARKTREFVNGTETNLITNRSKDDLQTNISDREDSRYTLLLSKIVSIIYKVVNVFKKVSLYRILVYSSAILSTLVVIPTYIFIKRRTNWVGGVFSAIVAGTSVAYFSHWAYGCFDTDILLYTLPVAYICAFMEAIIEKDRKKKTTWIIISSISFVLLMTTWDVFGVYYFLTVGSALIVFIFSLIKERFNINNTIKSDEVTTSFICVIVYTLLSLIVTKGIDISILRDIISVIKPSSFNNMSYPNPGKYTSELLPIDFISFKDGNTPLEASGGSLINKLGGIFIVILFLAGTIILISKVFKYLKNKEEKDRKDFIIGIILIIWAIGGLLSTRMGLRFVKMAAIPVNLLAAYAIGTFYEKFNRRGYRIPVIFLCLSFLLTPCLGAQNIANSMSHSATDALAETANYIKEHTSEKAVIASWWDYGYFFEYQAERRAIADGGTYNGRFIYYLANALATTDELTSTNILKMLSSSGTTVSYIAEEYFEDSKTANEVLMEVFSKSSADEANKLLVEKYELSDVQASNITKYTHPQLDYEIVLVITSSMLRMKNPINYFSHYDFETGNTTQEQLDVKSTYLRLYDLEEDTEYYTHLLKNIDITGRLSTNVFIIK